MNNLTPELSIVIPVYNESESVSLLHNELFTVLTSLNKKFEIIFIDDGSNDDTLSQLKKLTPVRIISLTHNFGKSQALQAGFRVANGRYILTLDGDLQDNPHEIPNFLKTIQDNQVDLICGWKQNRIDSFAKRMVSKIANTLIRFFTKTTVHDMNCGFKLYRKEVVNVLNLYGDMHRYIPALVSALGFRVIELPVTHRERRFGVSKYGNFRRFFKSFFDFITLLLIRRFIDKPMHIFGIIGTIFSLFGIFILFYLTYIKIFIGVAIGQRPILLLGILLVVIGIQLFSSGFLGELIIRQNNNRNIYIVREDIKNDN